MKDSARILTIVALALAGAGCAKSSQTKDVAQDSILVKDADLAEHKTDTGTVPATLVRDRGSVADVPTLTSGAPVKRSPTTNTATSNTGLQPPTRVNPTPVLPGRESTSYQPSTPTPNPPVTAQPTTTPTPVTQPVSPKPPVVIQPPTTPKKDSTRDSLRVR